MASAIDPATDEVVSVSRGWTRLVARLKPPPLSRADRLLLVALGTTNIVNAYDFSILTLALPQIQHDLAVAEHEVGAMISVIRLGVIPALLLTMAADREGRRRLLLVTILGFTVATFLSAFAQNATQFMVLQLLARTFIAAEDMLAVVVVAEELDASARGWGIGLFIAFGGIGHGLGSIMFSRIDALPYGWRFLYAIGVLPLFLIAWYRRRLHETKRFHALVETDTELAKRSFWTPARRLVATYPGRLIALAGAVVPCYFMLATALAFQSKFLQEDHGFSPAQVAGLTLLGGGLALLGNLAAGYGSDRLGRRPLLVAALIVNAGSVAAFYNAPGSWAVAAWVLMFFTFFGLEVLFSAFGAELFPTSFRSTASGARAVMSGLGAAIGLSTEGFLYSTVGSHAGAVTTMIAPALVAPLVALLWVPETAGRELEAIAPEHPWRTAP